MFISVLIDKVLEKSLSSVYLESTLFLNVKIRLQELISNNIYNYDNRSRFEDCYFCGFHPCLLCMF